MAEQETSDEQKQKALRTALEAELVIVDSFAAAALQARLSAAWINPGPSLNAYEKAKGNQPPDAGPLGFSDWIAHEAYGYAMATWRERNRCRGAVLSEAATSATQQS